MRYKIYIILCLCFSLQLKTLAQSVKDSSFRILMVGVHFSGQLPKYDLEKRFGPNLSAGGSFIWKTKHNLLFSVEGSYFFGNNVREDVVSSIRNDKGQITDNEGYPADLFESPIKSMAKRRFISFASAKIKPIPNSFKRRAIDVPIRPQPMILTGPLKLIIYAQIRKCF